MVRGFCDLGPLASPRIKALVPGVVRFLQEARAGGIGRFWFLCDSHPEASPEFLSFPPHCQEGSAESQLHPQLEALDLGPDCRRFDKGSLNGFLESELQQALDKVSQEHHFLLIGDCTDLCIQQAAMHLRMVANCRQRNWRVEVVADLVQTYDITVEVASKLGLLPHPGDFCHLYALYQLKLNGCEVSWAYSSISA